MRPIHLPLIVGPCALLLAFAAGASGRVGIVSEHRLAREWTPGPGHPHEVAYPVAAADKSPDVCVSIGFMIQPDGTTTDFTELKSWSSASAEAAPSQAAVGIFVQSAAALVSRWRFVPTKPRPRPVYTSASFAFDGGHPLAPEAIRERCRIGDLAAFVARAQSSRRELGRGRVERPTLGAERYARHPDQALAN